MAELSDLSDRSPTNLLHHRPDVNVAGDHTRNWPRGLRIWRMAEYAPQKLASSHRAL